MIKKVDENRPKNSHICQKKIKKSLQDLIGTMTKKIQSTLRYAYSRYSGCTLDEFKASMTEQQKREYEEEYTSLLINEMIAAAMENDKVSVRKLAKAAGVSPTIVQGARSIKP